MHIENRDMHGPGRQKWIGTGKEYVCKTVGFDNLAEDQANAALIAASPDLLSALEGILKRYDDEERIYWANEVTEARKAIAKAKGGA